MDVNVLFSCIIYTEIIIDASFSGALKCDSDTMCPVICEQLASFRVLVVYDCVGIMNYNKGIKSICKGLLRYLPSDPTPPKVVPEMLFAQLILTSRCVFPIACVS